MKHHHRYGMIFLVIWLAFQFLHASQCLAKTPAQSNNGLISLTLKETNIADVYEMLSKENNINILLAKGVEGFISLNLYDVTVNEAIYSIAEAAGYAVERIKNGYLITQRDTAGKTIANGFQEVRTYKIQYSEPKNVTAILKNYLSRYGRIDLLEDRKILVVEDLPEFVSRIDQILAQLDQEPAQILIEAKIFSIKLDDTQRYGLDWTKTFTAGGGQGNVGSDHQLTREALNLAAGAAAGPPGLFFNYFNKNLEVQLNLLSEKGKVRTLSTPKLLALEHQEAQVIIGGRTGYKTTTTINQVTTENIQFLESGVILNVTPYIDRFGRIMMDIHPEVSEATLRADGIPDLVTSEVNTSLVVEDGQTIFIGGLMKNVLDSKHKGVPILEDIPFLGYLFAKQDDISENTETIVLIKPQIIRPNNIAVLTSPNNQVNRYMDTTKRKSEKIDKFFKKNYMFRTD